MMIVSINIINIIVVRIAASRVHHIIAVSRRCDQAIKIVFIILPIGIRVMLPAV